MKKDTHNLTTANFATEVGLISLQADNNALTKIILPRPSRQHVTAKHQAMPDHPVLQNAARQISEYLQGSRTSFELPLTITGTNFQQKVWQIIKEIPYGQTLSYGDIARKLGGTGKARAVGGAAHANPLPLVIPCHRVIGSDGSLTGFGGGLELKTKLLALEKAV